jgi:hypothetical protein
MVVLTILLQVWAGAYRSEFGNDEYAHYVSSLLIHDYIVGGQYVSPVTYLRQYHAHYPVVGIGHWGPLAYFAEAAWMLLFGWGRTSVILSSAGITVATAAVLFHVLARRFGGILAGFAAVSYILSPPVQAGTASLMLDNSIALICLLAMVAYRRYIESGRALFSGLFGLLAVAGMLVKGNAACLALLPAFVVVIGGHWPLLRRPSFWLPVPIVLVLAGPWYFMTYPLVSPGFRYTWGLEFIAIAGRANAEIMAWVCGPLAIAAGLVGVGLVLARRRPHSADALMVTAVSLLASVIAFQTVVPAAIQDRYLVSALPPFFIACVFALHWIGCRAGTKAGTVSAVGAGLVLLAAMPAALSIVPKSQFGLIEAARQIWKNALPSNPSVLIATNGEPEGAIIAELAMRDPHRASIFAIRGSRLLGGGGYNTADYVPRFNSPQEIMEAIDDYNIPFVLVRGTETGNEWRHVDQVNQARKLFPERWKPVYESERDGVKVALYRIVGNDRASADIVRLIELSAPKNLLRR